MSTRLLSELSTEELGRVYDINTKLQNEVYARICDDEMIWVGEILDCFREHLRDWSIGHCNRNYVTLPNVESTEWRDFLDGLLECCKNFGFLGDADIEMVKKVSAASERLWLMDYDNKQYDNLCGYLEECAEQIESLILTAFNTMLDIDLDYPKQHFQECGCEMFPDDCYIDENFVLYEPRIIKYA